MKAYVITVMDLKESVQAAEKCKSSASDQGLNIETFEAITPKDDPLKILADKGMPIKGFHGKYSRLENCVAAFLSHYTLWEKCVDEDEEIMIFEHDAIVTSEIPINIPYNQLVSYGKPSYGRFNYPQNLGMNPLVSKRYLPGAHCYRMKPSAAKVIINKAKTHAGPTDVFLNINTFPWLEEYYPWPVEVFDNFTSIQKTEGCIAKHCYDKEYKIL